MFFTLNAAVNVAANANNESVSVNGSLIQAVPATPTGAVTYKSSNTDLVSINGTTATIKKAGTVKITATVAVTKFGGAISYETAAQSVTVQVAP